MEMLHKIAATDQKELIEALKSSELREQKMMARKERVVPHEHGNRKERRAYQAQLRKQKSEFA